MCNHCILVYKKSITQINLVFGKASNFTNDIDSIFFTVLEYLSTYYPDENLGFILNILNGLDSNEKLKS